VSRTFWILVGVAGFVYLSKKGYLKIGSGAGSGTGAGPKLSPKLAPAEIAPSESVTASSYRVLQSRRANLSYVQAQGDPGGLIAFASPAGGRFTRNIVVEGGQVWAEIAA
jgi:hypothetical protein